LGTQKPHVSISGQLLYKRRPGEQEEQRDLHVEADEDEVAGAPGHCPDRGAAAAVQHGGVDDLVKPVHQPKRHPSEDDFPPPPPDLDRIDIDCKPEQRDRAPLEVTAIAQHAQRFVGEASVGADRDRLASIRR